MAVALIALTSLAVVSFGSDCVITASKVFIRLRPGTELRVSGTTPSSHVQYDPAGAVTANNGAVLTIKSGTNSVTITADEIEVVSEAKKQ
jgi:hypothetical protein